MRRQKLQQDLIQTFEKFLIREEKSRATIEKYMRDIRCFYTFLDGRAVTKETTVAYKTHLAERYAPASVNSMLVALNVFLKFAGALDCCVKLLKVQRQIFCREDKHLTKAEFQRLVKAAGRTQISYVMQTICATGIRVSELQYITAEAVYEGKAMVSCKNKMRVIFIPGPLQRLLKKYMKSNGVASGPIFVTKKGKPLDRSSVWRKMKALCDRTAVCAQKVFPHNLRHLFARTFYEFEQDIVRLADLLGHSSINTTRIYTVDTGNQHIRCLERIQTVLLT